jgi:hypothetical protein
VPLRQIPCDVLVLGRCEKDKGSGRRKSYLQPVAADVPSLRRKRAPGLLFLNSLSEGSYAGDEGAASSNCMIAVTPSCKGPSAPQLIHAEGLRETRAAGISVNCCLCERLHFVVCVVGCYFDKLARHTSDHLGSKRRYKPAGCRLTCAEPPATHQRKSPSRSVKAKSCPRNQL